ncbi:RecQ family ATP-dependent DNA helicase [Furfurilactobacillus siliginis]|uniref:ATP-dependent DNA helicase n=1 Tax=Furfurilactobacillus siliginis TaxID=348151 RepID=A0A0R2L5K4_9LACO|nr:RecQ family ATP-dependent DNA helicase [Furfurilactobacillus siliginis]KRN97023.1 ATP-dependent DNA helicase [Furfurilactobacillus siliginis]GEK27783.1 ATP-dependent DNA helicase RecQ [Furfurilactobacillus siliginis]
MAVDPTHVKQNDPRLKLKQSDVDFARERQAALRTHFGFSDFHPGQAAALDGLQHGRDVLAVLPTGSGKTLVYELATYLLNRPCLVVSPLLSLMQDQVGRLNQRGERRAVAINSMMTPPERMQALQRLDQFRFIFTSPEMLLNNDVIQALRRLQIGLLVIDEAHCISTWGPDFRPAYRSLGTVREALGEPLTLAVTATADHQVQTDIEKVLQLSANHAVVRQSVDRTNIFLNVMRFTSRKQKNEALLTLVESSKKPGIIYFSSKKQADEWAQRFQVAGINAASYHAGLEATTRFSVQQQFMLDRLQVVCATSAFGMGIDKADIRFVIHYHMPSNLLDYVQEIGRAGRDGQQSIATLLVAPGDAQLPADLADLQLPDKATIGRVYAEHQPVLQSDPERLVGYYKEHGYGMDELIELLAKRLQSRRLALRKLMQYIDEPDCLRKNLLAAFDESAPSHDDHCCANSATTMTLSSLDLADDEPRVNLQLPDWQTQMRQLFSEKFIN